MWSWFFGSSLKLTQEDRQTNLGYDIGYDSLESCVMCVEMEDQYGKVL